MASKRGFTLIELLVVISIIGVLASIILVSLNQTRIKAKKARAREELAQIIRASTLARILVQNTLQNVTGNNCTSCGTAATAVTSLTAISSKSGVPNLQTLTTDPWGGYYTMDENEGEGGVSDCRHDSIYPTGGVDLSTTYNLEYYTAYCQANPSGTSGWQASL